MKFALPICLALSPGVSAEPCVLKEECPRDSDCAFEILSLEFSGSPPQKIVTNFGDFTVEQVLGTGEALSTITSGSGINWTVKTTQKLLLSSNNNGPSRQRLSLTVDEENEFSATLLTVPQKYSAYEHARRVFTGPCEKVF